MFEDTFILAPWLNESKTDVDALRAGYREAITSSPPTASRLKAMAQHARTKAGEAEQAAAELKATKDSYKATMRALRAGPAGWVIGREIDVAIRDFMLLAEEQRRIARILEEAARKQEARQKRRSRSKKKSRRGRDGGRSSSRDPGDNFGGRKGGRKGGGTMSNRNGEKNMGGGGGDSGGGRDIRGLP